MCDESCSVRQKFGIPCERSSSPSEFPQNLWPTFSHRKFGQSQLLQQKFGPVLPTAAPTKGLANPTQNPWSTLSILLEIWTNPSHSCSKLDQSSILLASGVWAVPSIATESLSNPVYYHWTFYQFQFLLHKHSKSPSHSHRNIYSNPVFPIPSISAERLTNPTFSCRHFHQSCLMPQKV